MKRILTILTMVGIVLIGATAIADELRPITSNVEVGSLMYVEAFGPQRAILAHKDFSMKVAPAVTEGVDVGLALYNDEFAAPKMYAETVITGFAAGGPREDESTRIWDKALGPGGSDLP